MDPNKVKRVVVVGAGRMGHAIAQVFAQAGIEVGLVDTSDNILQHALTLMESNLEVLADYSRISPEEIPHILARIHPATNLHLAAQDADFAMEVVVEVSAVKKEIFKQLEEACPEGTILASNTSALDVFSLAEIKQPSRLVTAHWCSPPHISPLVEIAPGPQTSQECVAFTTKLMERLGKRPIVLKRFMPAFIVNRVQGGIIRAILELLDQDLATPAEIDLAIKSTLGIRLPIVGVVQSLDFTGLDLIYDLQKSTGQVNPVIESKVKQGHLGASTSKGLYDYGGRSEKEILRKRDELYLKILNHMESIKAFEPV